MIFLANISFIYYSFDFRDQIFVSTEMIAVCMLFIHICSILLFLLYTINVYTEI